jgi:hypothetical protein
MQKGSLLAKNNKIRKCLCPTDGHNKSAHQRHSVENHYAHVSGHLFTMYSDTTVSRPLIFTTDNGSRAPARMMTMSPQNEVPLDKDRLTGSLRWRLKRTRKRCVCDPSYTVTTASWMYGWILPSDSTASANGKWGPPCLAGWIQRVGSGTSTGLRLSDE